MKKLLMIALAALMLVISACANRVPISEEDLPTDGPEETSVPQESRFGALGSLRTADGFCLTGMLLEGSGDYSGGDGPALLRNGREYSAEDIRVLFELDEWISLGIAYTYSGEYAKLGCWIFPYDGTEPVDFDSPEGSVYFAEYELPYETYPAPLLDEFSLSSADVAPGEYELIMTVNKTPVGKLRLRFFAPGELGSMTEEALESAVAVG